MRVTRVLHVSVNVEHELAPTRELATQITAAIQPMADAYCLKSTTIFGGGRPLRVEL